MNTLREQLSDEQHEVWSGWMKYMFQQGTLNSDGTWIMPKEKVDRWHRQMNTPYAHLTDREQESDREIADRIIRKS